MNEKFPVSSSSDPSYGPPRSSSSTSPPSTSFNHHNISLSNIHISHPSATGSTASSTPSAPVGGYLYSSLHPGHMGHHSGGPIPIHHPSHLSATISTHPTYHTSPAASATTLTPEEIEAARKRMLEEEAEREAKVCELD